MVFHKLHNSDDGASLNELAFNDARDALVKKIMDLQGGSKDEIIYYNNSGNEGGGGVVCRFRSDTGLSYAALTMQTGPIDSHRFVTDNDYEPIWVPCVDFGRCDANGLPIGGEKQKGCLLGQALEILEKKALKKDQLQILDSVCEEVSETLGSSVGVDEGMDEITEAKRSPSDAVVKRLLRTFENRTDLNELGLDLVEKERQKTEGTMKGLHYAARVRSGEDQNAEQGAKNYFQAAFQSLYGLVAGVRCPKNLIGSPRHLLFFWTEKEPLIYVKFVPDEKAPYDLEIGECDRLGTPLLNDESKKKRMSFDKGMKWIKKHKVKSYRPREVSLVMQTAHQRSMEALRRQIQAADSLEDLIADGTSRSWDPMESDWIESHLSRPVLSEGLWRRPLKSESSQPIRDVIENNKALGKEKEVAYNDPEIDYQRLGSAGVVSHAGRDTVLASVPHDAKLRPSYDLIDHDDSLLERWPELDVRPKNWTSKKGVSRALNVSDSTGRSHTLNSLLEKYPELHVFHSKGVKVLGGTTGDKSGKIGDAEGSKVFHLPESYIDTPSFGGEFEGTLNVPDGVISGLLQREADVQHNPGLLDKIQTLLDSYTVSVGKKKLTFQQVAENEEGLLAARNGGSLENFLRVFVSTFGARLSDLETPRDFETLENRMLALMSFEEVINIKVLFLSHLDASEHTSHIDFLKDLKRIHKKKDQVLAMSSLSDIPSLQTTLTNRLSPIDIPDDSLSSSPIVQHMLELHAHAQEHVFELLQNSLDNHTDVQWFLDILESKNTSVLKRAFRIHPFRIRSVAKFLKVLEDAVSLDFARDSQKYHRTPKDDSETFDEIDDGMQAANAFVTWSKETLGVYDLSSNQVVSDLFQLIRYSAHFLR